MNFWYPQGPCLSWVQGSSRELGSCNKSWLTGSPAALSTMRTFSHSLSSPVYCKDTGGWSLSHHALCQQETLRSTLHPSLGSVFMLLLLDIDVFGLLDGNLSSEWDAEKLFRVDGAKELETSCCVLTTESLCPLTRTTYQCHCVKNWVISLWMIFSSLKGLLWRIYESLSAEMEYNIQSYDL